MSARRQISAFPSAAVKLWILVVAALLGVILIGMGIPAAMNGQLLGDHLGFGLFALFLLHFGRALQETVEMDDEFLFVSRFRTIVAIPLNLVASASETVGSRWRSISVRFSEQTPVGFELTFPPPALQMFWKWETPHPVLVELQSIARRNQARRSK